MLSDLNNAATDWPMLSSELEWMLRVVVAGGLGFCIGMERSYRRKEAGIRTHCIVALASALFMILSKYAFMDCGTIDGLRGADASRIASQVVSGISFLGAGIIVHHGGLTVKGLTTAAGIWCTSAIGMAIGAGLYWIGCFSAVVVIMIQAVFHAHPVAGDNQVAQDVTIELCRDRAAQEAVQTMVTSHHGIINTQKLLRKEESVFLKLYVQLTEPLSLEETMELMESYDAVRQIAVEE